MDSEELPGMFVCSAWGPLSFLCGWLLHIGHRISPGIMGFLLCTGVIFWGSKLYTFYGFVKRCFSSCTHFDDYGCKQGAWALVSGAIDHTGRGYAKKLAAEGFNIAMISSHQELMDQLGKEIQEEVSADSKVKTICVETTKPCPETFEKIGSALEGLNVSILINNATVRTAPEYFHDTREEDINRVIDVNVRFTTFLTKLIFNNHFAARNERGEKSAVVNVSSPMAHLSSPFSAAFAGSKAYVSSFSKSLSCETEEMGIDVLSVTPGNVEEREGMTGLLTCTGGDNATATLTRIGHGELEATPWWLHSIQQEMFTWIPEEYVGKFTFKHVADARDRVEAFKTLQKRKAERAAQKSTPAPQQSAEETGIRQRDSQAATAE